MPESNWDTKLHFWYIWTTSRWANVQWRIYVQNSFNKEHPKWVKNIFTP